MSKILKSLIAVVAILAIVLLLINIFSSPASNDNGVVVGASSGPDHYNYENFLNGIYGKFLTEGGKVLSFTATSTQGARTLTQDELLENNIINIVSTSSPVLALTLPATSTMTKLLPTAGDVREWYIDNLHAAATTTTITAGAGIDLIAVTTADDVIDGLETSRLTCYRKANTDVMCIVSELLKAD